MGGDFKKNPQRRGKIEFGSTDFDSGKKGREFRIWDFGLTNIDNSDNKTKTNYGISKNDPQL